MILQSQSSAIINDFNQAFNTSKRKVRNYTLAILGGIFAAIAIVFGILAYMLDNMAFLVFLVGAFLALAFIAVMIILIYTPSMPTYAILYPRLIKLLNMERDEPLRHEHQTGNTYKDINRQSGLFSRGASVRVRQAITGKSDTGIPFHRVDATMTVSTGQSASTVFDGVLIHLEQTLNKPFYVAYKGKFHLKGLKTDRLDGPDGIRIFVGPAGYDKRIIDQAVSLVQRLSREHGTPHVYLSSTDAGLFLGYRYPIRRMRQVDHDTIKSTLSLLKRDLDLVEGLNMRPEAFL